MLLFPLSLIIINILYKQLINDAAFPIDLFWLGNKLAPVTIPMKQNENPINSKTGISLDSYPDDIFRVKFVDGLFDIEADFVKQLADETIFVDFNNQTGALSLRLVTAKELLAEKMDMALQLCGAAHKDGYAECVSDQVRSRSNNLYSM
jgi:hypothetical protein